MELSQSVTITTYSQSGMVRELYEEKWPHSTKMDNVNQRLSHDLVPEVTYFITKVQ